MQSFSFITEIEQTVRPTELKTVHCVLWFFRHILTLSLIFKAPDRKPKQRSLASPWDPPYMALFSLVGSSRHISNCLDFCSINFGSDFNIPRRHNVIFVYWEISFSEISLLNSLFIQISVFSKKKNVLWMLQLTTIMTDSRVHQVATTAYGRLWFEHEKYMIKSN